MSRPERGDNAVLKLARALDALDRHLAPRLAGFSHPVLGPSTLNIGTFHGGTRPNIVPDSAAAEIDIRITPALSAAGGALRLLRETVAALELPLAIVNPHENPPMETPLDHPDVRRLLQLRAASRATGAPWFSDAAHLAAGGLPSVCLGPGSIDQAHTADEFIDLDAFHEGVAMFTALLDSFG
jgi:acetylornithine deacetylase